MPKIKGWKKTYNGKYKITYKCTGTHYGKIDIVKSPHWGWMVIIQRLPNRESGSSKDGFKTKQAALKFAINWMKRHPNG